MKFSIITVTFNAGDLLGETINNILSQNFDDFEVVIKDGRSTDHSLKNVPISEKIALRIDDDKGIYDAMNQAVSMAKGDYVIFMNAGDRFYDNDVLQKVSDVIDANPGRGIYYGDTYFRPSKSVVSMPSKITPGICYRHIPCHQSCVFARSLYEGGGFDLEYKIRADYEFFLRNYFVKKINPCYLNTVIADYEGGGYSATHLEQDAKEHKIITEKYFTKGQLFGQKMFAIFTLQSLRKKLAYDDKYKEKYDKMKKMIQK
jgi:glycosyltransferase involved in cell wall biosynthesis